MTFVVSEIPEEYVVRLSGNSLTANRSFMVYDDAGSLTDAAAALALVGAVSLTGGISGSTATTSIGSVHPEFSTLYANEYEIRPHRDAVQGEVWIVSFRYGTTDFTEEAVPPDEEDYVDLSLSINPILLNVWRGGSLTVPGTDAGRDDPSQADDIGGDFIDSAGEPVSAPYAQELLTLRENVAKSAIAGRLESARTQINTRNSAVYMGAAIGKLAFTGITDCSRVNRDIFQLSYSFAYDDNYHLRQQAELDVVTGDPLLRRPPLSSDLGKASQVYWVQPFTSRTAFADLGIDVSEFTFS